MLQYPHWYIKHFPMKNQNLSSLPLTVFSTNTLGFSLRLKLLYVEFSFAISLLLEILISRNLCNSKILVLAVRLYMNCIHPIGIVTEIIQNKENQMHYNYKLQWKFLSSATSTSFGIYVGRIKQAARGRWKHKHNLIIHKCDHIRIRTKLSYIESLLLWNFDKPKPL